jgi:hypothetical protein
MQLCSRIYYSTAHWRLNMFRAAYRSSSGAVTVFAVSGLHTHVVTDRSQVYGRSPHAYVNQRLQIQLELLMMSGVPLETCWTFNERWNNKFCYKVASCWLFLLNHTTMHGSINIKSILLYIFFILFHPLSQVRDQGKLGSLFPHIPSDTQLNALSNTIDTNSELQRKLDPCSSVYILIILAALLCVDSKEIQKTFSQGRHEGRSIFKAFRPFCDKNNRVCWLEQYKRLSNKAT